MSDRDYVVVAPNGYRKANLTKEAALAHAARLREQMKTAGWRGVVRVYYRNGKEVVCS